MLDSAIAKITQETVDSFRWFHSIDFGNGVVSKGVKDSDLLNREAAIIFRHGVEGKSVLDIGAWDGFFSFEALRRGASAVMAVDGFIWADKGWGSRQPFDLGNAANGSRVTARIADVYGMTPENSGTHDVVLFNGVIYHLKHPLLAIERVAALTREYAVMDTETALDHLDEPLMKFFPGKELAGDPTNWCAPNIACMKAWLMTAGFKKVEVHPHTNHVGKPLNPLRGRNVFHAWK